MTCGIFYNTMISILSIFFFFFFNDTATTEIYTLSLHDALPIYRSVDFAKQPETILLQAQWEAEPSDWLRGEVLVRSEEHTSELQSPCNLVCRLLLEKKNNSNTHHNINIIPTYYNVMSPCRHLLG